MADDTPQTGAAPGATDGAQNPRINGVTQYVKDLSFESPRSPASILQGDEEPHGELKVQVKVRRLGDDNYEVVLQFQIEATKDDEIAFLIELQFAGVFTVTGFAEEDIQPALMVECPRILYPFARRVIADTVRDGGFPQLMLGPIDFVQLFQMYGPHMQAGASPGDDAGVSDAEAKTADA